MKSGIKPLAKTPKKQFHQYFGGTLSVPDFLLDTGLWNPSQDADGKQTECTSYFIADTFTDYKKKLYAPGFSYGATMFTEGVQPTTAGADPLAALQSAVICGALPAPFAVPDQSELEDANWNNWNTTQKAVGLNNAAVDVHSALGFTDAFTSILSAMWTGQVAVALCTPFYEEWLNIGPDGIIPMPQNVMATTGLPWHCHAAKGKKTINGVPYIPDKVWIGPSWAHNGIGYMPQNVLNAVMLVPGSGALVLVMTGSRWLPLCKIVVTRPQTIGYAFPRVLQFAS